MAKGRAAAVAAVVFLACLPSYGQAVDPKIHRLCSEAKDYAGCVKAMTGEASAPQRVITQQGADIAEGNQCPSGFAYVGGGNCQQVTCSYSASGMGSGLGHDPIVAGKPGWKCGWSWINGAGELRLGTVSRATNNPKCPPGEPQLGYNSTCQVASSDKDSKNSAPKSRLRNY